MKCPHILVLFCLLVNAWVHLAEAQVLFTDRFENDLSLWVGKNGGGHTGSIVDDPIRPGNRVLTFTELTGGGDIFGTEFSVSPCRKYMLSFDYLGLPSMGGVPGNLGGAIGFAEDTPGSSRWVAGTVLDRFNGLDNDALIDDGQWHSYEIEIAPFVPGLFYSGTPRNSTIRVMMEDWGGSGGVPGDALFDNVSIWEMPSGNNCGYHFRGHFFPGCERAFADTAFYIPGGSVGPPHNDPDSAIGLPDGYGVSLGVGGSLVLRFDDNRFRDGLGPDIYVAEVGSAAEAMNVEISVDGLSWRSLGVIPGGGYALDISAVTDPTETFAFVRLSDVYGGSFPYAGPDVDAVGAISSIASCDFNLDGSCDLVDLDLMQLLGPIDDGVPAPGNERYDLNWDGTIDLLDRHEWLALAADENGFDAAYQLGDANLDGSIDGSDFSIWNTHKFTPSLLWSHGNFNADDAVDGSDFSLWNVNKFTGPGAQVYLPEPTEFALVVLLAVTALRRRFRPPGTLLAINLVGRKSTGATI